MQVRKLTMLILGGLLALVLPAGADLIENCGWDHPCDASNQTCVGQFCPPTCTCFCKAEWNIPANWLEIRADCIGDPDTPIESALIWHSNTGYCSDGTLCSEDTDCTKPTRPCDDFEAYLLLELTTETIDWLDITTKNTNATDDKLEVRFESKNVCVGGGNAGSACTDDTDCPGGTCDTTAKTLTVGGLDLHATFGPITLKIYDAASLKTDTTD